MSEPKKPDEGKKAPRYLKVQVAGKKPRTFWRCGRCFSSQEPTYIERNALTDDEIERLLDEPNLRVAWVDEKK